MAEGKATSRVQSDIEDVPRTGRMLAPSENEVEAPDRPGVGDNEAEGTRRPKRRRWSWMAFFLVFTVARGGSWRLLSPHGGPEKRTTLDV
jgi:hypothetical protein